MYSITMYSNNRKMKHLNRKQKIVIENIDMYTYMYMYVIQYNFSFIRYKTFDALISFRTRFFVAFSGYA